MAKLPLQSSNNINMDAPAPAPGSKKTIEEMYQKKTQLEHILLRPDTYIGSIEKHTQSLWVWEEGQMVFRPISYVPGLYKIFDEILVNAADNKQRDPSMDSVKVVIDVEQNFISVCNNGDGVPVEIHQEEKVYVPELIFGHLLTSSNYDDNEKKTTGGRNGYGAKLANIFSTEFVIETADGKRQKKYKQVFSNNMGKKSEPMITKCRTGENWTKVSFKPDLAKFNMTHLEADVVALMRKRVIDLSGCLGKTVKVELNGSVIPVKSFKDYVDLYLTSAEISKGEKPKSFSEKVNDRWEVFVSLSDGQFQQVSFVNSIATIKGGTHVDYVTNQIANHVMAYVNKKKKDAKIKAHNVKNHLWVFVNALIDNPAFDSQTKETLTLRQSSFGSKCELSEKLLDNVAKKSGIADALLSWAEFKQSKDLKKTDGSKTQKIKVDKLDDAIDAGGRNSDKCTLILTEGDSAKQMATGAVKVIGRDRYGFFPLRGKLLNVREASVKQLSDNEEIKNLKKILGLQEGKAYDNVKSLRYGHVMIMTDQDHDGSHIKGLLINFFHACWPSLLKVPSFLVEFITPIVKATHRSGKKLAFYTMPEYESWRESLGGNATGWSIKYYKGLGTSTPKEAAEYFSDLAKHKKDFMWADDQDGEAIELAFSKKKIEARKNWLRQHEPGSFLDQSQRLIKYSDFINKELILFSLADLQRSIPSMVDGFKPGQRKILFCAFKKNFVKEAKVAQFAGYVSEQSAYHHGEASLQSTIVGMAQNFMGSNNINLLVPSGQFGTRCQGGKDHASARYIYTQLCPITRFIFPKDDDILLNYLNDDGLSIEPTWYMPIIPMVLVNGSEGIGTGWSSYVPNYNPRDVIANLRHLINGELMEPMHPWYRGFRGTIERTATKETGVTYTVSGFIEEVNETTLRITELPVRKWTEDYKKFLDSLENDSFILDYKNYSDDVTVDMIVTLTEENMMAAKQEGLLKKFKLTSTISTSNMHLFDPRGVIKKYDTPEQILEEFYQLRLEFYEKRKNKLLENLELELLKLDNKVRFILGVVSGEIVVSNRKKADLVLELHEKGFTPFPKKTKSIEAAGATDDTEEAEENPETVGNRGIRASDYDYLLSMSIATLTLEKVQELCNDRDKVAADVDYYRNISPSSLWLRDLEALERQLDEQDILDAAAVAEQKDYKSKQRIEAGAKPRNIPKAPRKTNKKASNLGGSETIETSSSIAMETGSDPKVVKPKGRAASKKAPAKKQEKASISVTEENELNSLDDEIPSLAARIAAYNMDSSPDHSMVMESEAPQEPARRKEPSKRAAAKKHTVSISETSDGEDEDDDDDFDLEEAAPSAAAKKGGRKQAANAKAAKPAAAPKKRGPASKQQTQKLLTEMLKPAEDSGISPEKKVRKMRASPFNKKSGSLLGRASRENEANEAEEKSGSASSSNSVEEPFVAAPKARPQRANRRQATIVLSDSESDNVTDDDYDFDEEED